MRHAVLLAIFGISLLVASVAVAGLDSSSLAFLLQPA